VRRDVEVDDPPAAMNDHEKAIDYIKGDRWGHKEVGKFQWGSFS